MFNSPFAYGMGFLTLPSGSLRNDMVGSFHIIG